jgi:hypothetical protein
MHGVVVQRIQQEDPFGIGEPLAYVGVQEIDFLLERLVHADNLSFPYPAPAQRIAQRLALASIRGSPSSRAEAAAAGAAAASITHSGLQALIT